MRYLTILILLLLGWLTLIACNSETTTDERSTPTTSSVEAGETEFVTPTSPEPTETDAVETTPSPGTATLEATTASEATVTATLSPIRATQQALADAVRLPTRSGTVESVAPDDYVALTGQACRIVQENYVRDDFNGVDWQAKCDEYRTRAAELANQEAFWDLMEDFIAELNDEHSRFVRPDRFAAEFRLPEEGGGQPWPGLVLNPAREDDRLLIWFVCESGTGAQAGLQRGDVILAIDGEPVQEGFDRADIYEALYAGDKDEVVLTVQQGPEAEPFDVRLEYGGGSGCDGWQYGILNESPRIGYIRIPGFGGDAASNILALLERLEEEQPLDGLVLDVRHNPGGNADQSIAIFTSGTFGKTGPLRADATQTIWRIRGPVRWNETTPVAVLTDGASHSAAEYFATAMQQSGRATLIGMPTAGNTEGIISFNLADGSLIRLAVMTLQLPDGTTLEGTGVQPDRQVPLGEWGLRQKPDVQVQAAIEVIQEQLP